MKRKPFTLSTLPVSPTVAALNPGLFGSPLQPPPDHVPGVRNKVTDEGPNSPPPHKPTGQTSWAFTVTGDPKAQPRPRLGKHGAYNPPTAKAWKAGVVYSATMAGLRDLRLTGPIAVTMDFHMPRPQAHLLRGSIRANAPTWHIIKPDSDNLAKAALDALTDMGVWVDDSQVCDLHITKRYATDLAPGVHITIRAIV